MPADSEQIDELRKRIEEKRRAVEELRKKKEQEEQALESVEEVDLVEEVEEVGEVGKPGKVGKTFPEEKELEEKKMRLEELLGMNKKELSKADKKEMKVLQGEIKPLQKKVTLIRKAIEWDEYNKELEKLDDIPMNERDPEINARINDLTKSRNGIQKKFGKGKLAKILGETEIEIIEEEEEIAEVEEIGEEETQLTLQRGYLEYYEDMDEDELDEEDLESMEFYRSNVEKMEKFEKQYEKFPTDEEMFKLYSRVIELKHKGIENLEEDEQKEFEEGKQKIIEFEEAVGSALNELEGFEGDYESLMEEKGKMGKGTKGAPDAAEVSVDGIEVSVDNGVVVADNGIEVSVEDGVAVADNGIEVSVEDGVVVADDGMGVSVDDGIGVSADAPGAGAGKTAASKPAAAPAGEKPVHVRCPTCQTIVVVTNPKRPLNFNCNSCGTPMFLGKPRKKPRAEIKPAKVRCPRCQEINEIRNPIRPITVQCEYCGMPLLLRGKPRPRPTPRSKQAAPQKPGKHEGVLIQCPECSKRMRVLSRKRPLKINCTLCGRELILK